MGEWAGVKRGKWGSGAHDKRNGAEQGRREGHRVKRRNEKEVNENSGYYLLIPLIVLVM